MLLRNQRKLDKEGNNQEEFLEVQFHQLHLQVIHQYKEELLLHLEQLLLVLLLLLLLGLVGM